MYKNKVLILSVILALSYLAFISFEGKVKEKSSVAIENKFQADGMPSNVSQNNGLQGNSEKEIIPDKVIIDVPFTSQAPYGIWDAYYEEACEEASLVMIKYFLDKKDLTVTAADDNIRKMIDFEIKNYGKYEDTDMEENIKLFHDFYGSSVANANLKTVYDFQKEDIKKYLAQGKPIIIPAAGRKLGNPYYTPPGPPYHNLVLIGYEGNYIITNDPGTRRGKNYRYKLDILYEAIHDFTGNLDEMEKGRKAMIVIE